MGRKGWKHELKTRKLAKLSEDVLIKALTTENSEDALTFREKAELAAKVYSRIIPKNHNINTEGNLRIAVIDYDKAREIRQIDCKVLDTQSKLTHTPRIDSKVPISHSKSKTGGE